MSLIPRYVGRMEKRIPIALVVHLTRPVAQSANGTELTYTDNVSAHGACVVSSRSWQPGEIAEVTSLKDETTLRGKVIHCQKRTDDRYRVGLTFLGRTVSWVNYSTYADA
jgi:PilZ domain